jgi:hypothetical protein
MARQKQLSVQRGRLTPGGDTVARDLGWFSIGLGLAELIGPRSVASMVGMRRSAPVLPLYGLRELATGIGILLADDPSPWVWGRVGGDALDLATLGVGMIGRRHRGRAVLAFLAVAGVTVLDVLCAQTLDARRRPGTGARFDYSDRSGLRARGVATPVDVTAPKESVAQAQAQA